VANDVNCWDHGANIFGLSPWTLHFKRICASSVGAKCQFHHPPASDVLGARALPNCPIAVPGPAFSRWLPTRGSNRSQQIRVHPQSRHSTHTSRHLPNEFSSLPLRSSDMASAGTKSRSSAPFGPLDDLIAGQLGCTTPARAKCTDGVDSSAGVVGTKSHRSNWAGTVTLCIQTPPARHNHCRRHALFGGNVHHRSCDGAMGACVSHAVSWRRAKPAAVSMGEDRKHDARQMLLGYIVLAFEHSGLRPTSRGLGSLSPFTPLHRQS
jgi:hypothetical protein